MNKTIPKILSIIIVNFNTRKLTLASLDSIFKETNQFPFEIFVVDNASSDDTVPAIQARFGEKVHIIASAMNLGFAGGNNQAAKSATGEYLLLLNPDTVVLDHAIDKLVAFAQVHPTAGIWGGEPYLVMGA